MFELAITIEGEEATTRDRSAETVPDGAEQISGPTSDHPGHQSCLQNYVLQRPKVI